MEIPRTQEPIRLVGGRVDHRDIELEAGDFLHAVIEQEGIDVEVRLVDPMGEIAHKVDSPNGKQGPEELLVIVEGSGRHRIEVVAPEGVAPGHYVFHEPQRRRASAEDRQFLEADRLYHRAYWQALGPTPGEALEPLGRALAVWRIRGLKAREAATLDALGLAYRKLEQLEPALVYSHQAAMLYHEVGDRYRLAYTLDRSGYLRLRLGNAAQALRELEEAQTLMEATGNHDDAAVCAGRLGMAYRSLGEVQRALGLLEGGLARLSPQKRVERAGLLVDYGKALLTVNRVPDAYDAFTEALDLYQALGLASGIATALGALADVAARAGFPEVGLEHAQEAAEMVVASEVGSRSRALTSLGSIQASLGQHAGARANLAAAAELAEKSDEQPLLADALYELGYLELLRQDPAAALTHLERAMQLFAAAGDRSRLASSQARSAQALQALGELPAARDRISLALETVEKLRADSRRRDVRLAFFGLRQEYYDIGVEILMDLHAEQAGGGHDFEALSLNERRLALELRTRLGRETEARPADNPQLLAREAALEQQLTALLAQRSQRASPELEQDLARLLAELNEVWDALSPAPSTAPETEAIAPKDFQQLLDPETLVLVYALGKQRSFLWKVSRDGITTHELAASNELEHQAELFYNSIKSKLRSSDAAGRRLAEALLGPVAAELGQKRLVLVLDGALQTIPFAALPKPGEEQSRLVESHEIVLLPSLTTLAQLRRAEAPRHSYPGAIAALADPVFSADDPRLESPSSTVVQRSEDDPRVELERLGRQLGTDLIVRLPYTRVEAEALLVRLPPSERFLATDLEASRETLLALPPGRYRALHIATHAVASPEHPELSGLVLSLVDASGAPHNGFVRAYEISRLELPLELVNLSACQTGVGPAPPGEGVLALSRAFLEAGAIRVVSSLWSVGDRSTAALMTRFYDAYLGHGLPPAAALREAQRGMLADPATARPYHWAAFVVQGDWRPRSP